MSGATREPGDERHEDLLRELLDGAELTPEEREQLLAQDAGELERLISELAQRGETEREQERAEPSDLEDEAMARFEAHIARTQDVVGELEQLGEAEREQEYTEPVALEDEAMAKFEAHLARNQGSGVASAQRTGPGRVLGMVLAVAAIVLALVLLRPDEDPSIDEPFYLGSGGLELQLSPEGEVNAIERFTWTPSTGAAYYALEVRPLGDEEAEPLVRIEDLEQTAWEPDATTRAALKEGIRWELYVYDELGEYLGSAWAEARSSP